MGNSRRSTRGAFRGRVQRPFRHGGRLSRPTQLPARRGPRRGRRGRRGRTGLTRGNGMRGSSIVWIMLLASAALLVGACGDLFDMADDCHVLLNCPPAAGACDGTCVPGGTPTWAAPVLVWLGDGTAPLCPPQAKEDALDQVAPPPAPTCGPCACDTRPSQPTPWTVARMCFGTTQGVCPNTADMCLPTPSAPSDGVAPTGIWTYCITHDGGGPDDPWTSCPGSDYPVQRVFGSGYTDSTCPAINAPITFCCLD